METTLPTVKEIQPEARLVNQTGKRKGCVSDDLQGAIVCVCACVCMYMHAYMHVCVCVCVWCIL